MISSKCGLLVCFYGTSMFEESDLDHEGQSEKA